MPSATLPHARLRAPGGRGLRAGARRRRGRPVGPRPASAASRSRARSLALTRRGRSWSSATTTVTGYMPAMTMEFAVSAGDAAARTPGERIRADLVVDRRRRRLENIWPDDKVTLDTIDAGRPPAAPGHPGPGQRGLPRGRRRRARLRPLRPERPRREQRPLPREAGHAQLHLHPLPGRQHVPALDDEDDGAQRLAASRRSERRIRLDHARTGPRHPGRPRGLRGRARHRPPISRSSRGRSAPSATS